MGKTIKAVPSTLTFKNTYTEDSISVKDLELANLSAPLADDDVFNTGLAALGNPHADEDASNAGVAVVKDPEAWKAQHVASIRLYKSNSYIYLFPGDCFILETRSGEETAYYLTQNSDLLTVTDGSETTEETAEPATVDAEASGTDEETNAEEEEAVEGNE